MSDAALLDRPAVAATPKSETAPRARSVADIAARELASLARRIDADGFYPEAQLRGLGAAGAYSHHAGGAGGLAAAIADTARVAEACLSTAFCMWSQNALVWSLAQTENRALAGRHLADAAAGVRLGSAELSNPLKALLGIERLAICGRRVKGGYRVSGRLPRVSNLGAGSGRLFGAVFGLAEGRKVMALFDTADPDVRLAQNTHFLALDGTATFSVGLHDVFVPDENILAEEAAAFIPRIRQGYVLLQIGLGVGLARGAARTMQADGSARARAAWLPHQPADLLDRAEAIEARAGALAATSSDPSRAAYLDVLRTRLGASWLALEAGQAGVLQAGARGYAKGSDASRRQRQAQFVAIVTPSVRHITQELARNDEAAPA